MKYLHKIKKSAIAIGALVVAAVPAILVDPSFGHYVAQHPWAATYLPLAVAALHAIEKKKKP